MLLIFSDVGTRNGPYPNLGCNRKLFWWTMNTLQATIRASRKLRAYKLFFSFFSQHRLFADYHQSEYQVFIIHSSTSSLPENLKHPKVGGAFAPPLTPLLLRLCSRNVTSCSCTKMESEKLDFSNENVINFFSLKASMRLSMRYKR